jgi:hypothetical protein
MTDIVASQRPNPDMQEFTPVGPRWEDVLNRILAGKDDKASVTYARTSDNRADFCVDTTLTRKGPELTIEQASYLDPYEYRDTETTINKLAFKEIDGKLQMHAQTEYSPSKPEKTVKLSPEEGYKLLESVMGYFNASEGVDKILGPAPSPSLSDTQLTPFPRDES